MLYERNGNEKLSVEQYLQKNKPHLLTDDLRTSKEWKIYLTMAINFMLSKDGNEKGLIHSK